MGAPPKRRRRRGLWIPVAAAALLVAVLLVLLLSGGGSKKLVPGGGSAGDTYDPLAYDSDRQAQFERDAAAGLSHVLYARSPGGAIATARRVAAWRPRVEAAAHSARMDPNLLEGIVFVESAGNPDVIAGGDPANASGLTQILAETGTNLLGMRIDLATSRRLTKRIRAAQRRHKPTRKLLAARRKADPRFDPAQALAATTRYLAFARGKLGRDDLAAVSYHMGVGNVQSVEKAYGKTKAPYAELYFDSTPLVHPAAYRLLARFGDDSSNYYWKLLAAEQIMRLYRTDPAGLARLAALHGHKASAEEVLHPKDRTTVFATAAALERAEATGALRALPGDPQRYGFAVDRGMGSLSRRPADFRYLRPEALGLLAYVASGVRQIGGSKQPLLVTSTVRDLPYQRLLVKSNREATHKYSLHTTGYAFDIERRYASRRQALAFQFMLDRLTALNLIAWVREPNAIHVTVSSAAKPLASLARLDRKP